MSEASPISDKESAWLAFHAIRAAEDGRPLVSSKVRLAVFEAANWRCCYCGVRLLSRMQSARECHAYFANEAGISIRLGKTLKRRGATIEHIRRRVDGGGNARENLAAACEWCNGARGPISAVAWFDEVARLKRAGKHPHFGEPDR
jgi:5-methylcytosine-specific restriction endonuclease McrA